MAHNQTHDHTHGSSKNIGIAFLLNLGFAVFEFFGGIYTNSIAITSDALHDLGDSISIGISWYFEKISNRKRNLTFTYGYRRFSILGATINAVILLVGSVIILNKTIPRLFNPVQADVEGMFWFAILGVIVNGAAVLKLKSGKSINEKVISLHLLEDVLGWLAVLVGSVIMYFFNAPIIDPILSLCISIYILINVYRNLKSIFAVILQTVPAEIDTTAMSRDLESIDGVEQLHDLHVWTMDSEYNIATLHLVVDNPEIFPTVKESARQLLRDKYMIEHSTIEIERPSDNCCFVDC